MRHTLAIIAIAALAAAWCVPAATQTTGLAPADARCKDGQLVELVVLLPSAGVFTLMIPPDICKPSAATRAPRPKAPASSSSRTTA